MEYDEVEKFRLNFLEHAKGDAVALRIRGENG